MIGAITGDVVGSIYENFKIKNKEFDLFKKRCRFTDDTVMTIAVANALVKCGTKNEESLTNELIVQMKKLGRKYPLAGYGGSFIGWLISNSTKPYNSFGNGSAMRVSPVSFVAETLEEAEKLAEITAGVTHNHPEGIKGARAVAVAGFLARKYKDKALIKSYIEENYYPLNFTLDEIRPHYKFDVTCQGSVPQAIVAFLESESFEDAIRNAVSLGGDSDTQGAMAGGIAEAYYGVDDDIKNTVLKYLDDNLKQSVEEFYSYIG
ncbi:MAG: ADP-ribosylglycohydrolase family protein [Acutalibacteraceae bacterium]|nr:ADP-ribosylglycohydrolase family protein [Acutalibacteraceae bacterium]